MAKFENEPRLTFYRIRQYNILCVAITVLVLVVLFLGNFLVSQPVWTIQIMIPLWAMVPFFTLLAGPSVGSSSTQWLKSIRDTKCSQKLGALTRTVLIFMACFLIVYGAFIIFGVSLTKSIPETLHFAGLVSVLAALPGWLLLGSNWKHWLRVLLGTGAQNSWEQLWVNTICGCTFGTWLGAFCIPLDWDRPWQVWPVSCCYGALVGYGLAHVCSLATMSQNGTRKKHY